MIINFQPRFAAKIEDGSKPHTIRKKGKLRYKPGDTLHLYTGARTKNARPLYVLGKHPVHCIKVDDFKLDMFNDVHINGRRLTWGEVVVLAKRDGFDSVSEFTDFFDSRKDGLTFEGWIIYWA